MVLILALATDSTQNPLTEMDLQSREEVLS